MNITYVFGNGFDIGLGMKTKYEEFYPYFEKHASEDNMIRKELVKVKEESGEYENWSALEQALGEFTEKIPLSYHKKFIDDKIELDMLLRKYLIQQEDSFKQVFDYGSVAKALVDCRDSSKASVNRLIEAIFTLNCEDEFNYEAISLNYTQLLDQCFEGIRNGKVALGEHMSISRVGHADQIGSVLHLHGTLKDDDIIVGVSDLDQISNSKLAEIERVQFGMIKYYANEFIGKERTNMFGNIIDNSGLICLYGVSLGKTDIYVWKYITDWLQKESWRILIIYEYIKEYNPSGYVERMDYEESVKNKFLNIAEMDESTWQKVKQQIVVYINRNDFAIEKIGMVDLDNKSELYLPADMKSNGEARQLVFAN